MRDLVTNFYADLIPITDFHLIFNNEHYQKVPEDWYIIITDVVNSTRAIESGRYKEVNIAGSLGIMAIANVIKDMNFPFIFGGDGMTFIIPEHIVEPVRDVLVNTREVINNIYDLKLRVGLIKVSVIYENKYDLFVSKYQVSDRYNQALISGSGLDFAEKLVKDKTYQDRYLVPENFKPERKADFSGFTCRWKDIPSHKEETISFIIKINEINADRQRKYFHEILEKIYVIFGNENEFHPLSKENFSLIDRKQERYKEAMVYANKKKGLKLAIIDLLISIQVFFVGLILKWGLKIKMKKKKLYEAISDNIISSDFRKFDGTLKMVISCSKKNRELFIDHLVSLHQENKIYYGVHVSDKAVMTCFIHLNSDSEVHFIDASGGGYAIAAMALKKQMAINDKK